MSDPPELELVDAYAPLWRIKILYACIGGLTGLIVGGLVAAC